MIPIVRVVLTATLAGALSLGCCAKTYPPGDIPANGAVLELGEVTFEGPDSQLLLHADGTLVLNGKPMGTLSTDGRLVSPSGALIGSVDADGVIRKADGSPVEMFRQLRLQPDGALHSSGGDLSIQDDGSLGDGHGHPGGQLKIHVDRRPVRRAAVFCMLMAEPAGVAQFKASLGDLLAKVQVASDNMKAMLQDWKERETRIQAVGPTVPGGPCDTADLKQAQRTAQCAPDGMTWLNCTDQGVWTSRGTCRGGCDSKGCNDLQPLACTGSSCPAGKIADHCADDVAVDATGVYWTKRTGYIIRSPLDGGKYVTLASGQKTPSAMALDATNAYWVDSGNGTVVLAPLAGGATTTLASGQSKPFDIGVDATSVYWDNQGDGTVMKVTIAGGAPVTIASGQDKIAHIAVGATDVYWTNSGASGTVMKAPLAGGPPKTVASAQNEPTNLALDATSVYWADQGGGAIVKAPLKGGAPVTLVSGQAGPWGIAVDATSVYWTHFASGAAVMKAPLAGGAPVTVASAQSWPSAVAVGPSGVYWVDGRGCGVSWGGK